MKQFLLIIGGINLFFMGYAQINFPNSADQPLWCEIAWHFNPDNEVIEYNSVVLTLIGDTLIDNNVYNKLYLFNDSILNSRDGIYLGGIREDSTYRIWLHTKNSMRLLYDFSKGIDDTIWYDEKEYHYAIIRYIDTLNYSTGIPRRVFYLERDDYYLGEWVEGIGSNWGLMIPFVTILEKDSIISEFKGNKLLCYYQNDSLIYKNCNGSCFPYVALNGMQLSENDIIRFFPNPTKGLLRFEYDLGVVSKVDIFSLAGILIRSYSINSNSFIDISDLKDGYYNLIVYTDNTTFTTRIIKY